MKKIIQLWKIFLEDWISSEKSRWSDDKAKGYIKPQFYDFMQWLAERKDLNLDL